MTAIDIDPGFIDAHYYLGKLLSGGLKNDNDGTLVQEPDNKGARTHYEKAIELDINYAKAHYNLALILT